MLSKKYYNAIAIILRENETREDIIVNLIEYFERDNPRFDREMFLVAVSGRKVFL